MMKSVLVKIDEVLNSVSNILNEEEFIKKLEKKNISLKSLRLLRIIFNVYDFGKKKFTILEEEIMWLKVIRYLIRFCCL